MEASKSSFSPALQIVEVACPACHCEEKIPLRRELEDIEDRVPGRYTISKCAACGFNYLSSTPPADQLPLCYPVHYHSQRTIVRNRVVPFLYELRCHHRARRVRKQVDSARIRQILEVGCGDASLLVHLERAWPSLQKVFGTELNPANLKLPQGSRIQLAAKLSDHAVDSSNLDLVILFEVLEHIPNPKEMLRELREAMKPGARLIGSSPNFESLWSRVFFQGWSGLQVPRHQLHFSPETIASMLTAAGFRVLRVQPAFDPGELALSVCNVLTQTLNLKARPRESWFYIPLVLLLAPLQFVQYKLFRSSGTLEFVAEKA